MNKYTKSEEGLFESTFVEIKNGNKSLIIGTIYRHPTAACNMFLEDFLHPILHELDQKRKKVVITGDFNFDMIKYNTHKPTSDFYDLLSSFSYKPLILDPSRITYKSNTLIDNIFVNDIGCISEGGNITSSISDHYLQFSINDMFGKTPKKKTTSYKRNFKNFKINEFVEELYKIDLINITANGTNINESFDIFFNTIEGLLNTMAPIRKQTKNEKRLEQRPWITKGLLKSMQIRDSLYRELSNGNPETKKKHFNKT